MIAAPQSGGLELTLVDRDGLLVERWSEEFAAWPDSVRVRRGQLESVDDVDAWVTAGNSYGQMDGGVDRAVAEHIPGIQSAVWKAIATHARGYLPVGSALVVGTGAATPWLVYAPTMRIPMSLRGPLESAVHDAFWAALVAVVRHNHAVDEQQRIRSIACPGFGTGFGRVDPGRAAQLMATAYRCWRAGPTAAIADRERDLAP